MSLLPAHLFANPIWHALRTTHRHFASRAGEACRYPADVAPFAAIAANSTAALRQLHSLLGRADSVWIVRDEEPQLAQLSCQEVLPCFQMALAAQVIVTRSSIEIARLGEADVPQMVALTTLAFPGYFRSRTCEMGRYYGVRSGGELIAMGGERLKLEGYSEISGVCTHPAHRGRGLAASIIGQLIRDQRRDGLVPWLHVGTANTQAIDLYMRMGFTVIRTVTLNRMRRID